MEMEQWLEDAMVIVNKWFSLMPSRVLKQCIELCHEAGWSLVSLARAGSEIGLVREVKLLELKDKIPAPLTIRPSREELLTLKNTHEAGLESARFLVNYSIGVSREIPVTMNFNKLDGRDARDFHSVVCALVGQTTRCDGQEEQKETSDGNSDSN